MRLNYRHFIILFFILLAITMLATNTIWRVCTVCGIQEYERQMFGTTIEFLSQREYDEFGTHQEYIEEYGQPHKPHEWKEVEEPSIDLLKR